MSREVLRPADAATTTSSTSCATSRPATVKHTYFPNYVNRPARPDHFLVPMGRATLVEDVVIPVPRHGVPGAAGAAARPTRPQGHVALVPDVVTMGAAGGTTTSYLTSCGDRRDAHNEAHAPTTPPRRRTRRGPLVVGHAVLLFTVPQPAPGSAGAGAGDGEGAGGGASSLASSTPSS